MWQTAPNGDWSPWFSHGTPPRFVLLGALANRLTWRTDL